MGSGGQAATTKQELSSDITDEQIQKLIAEKKRVGATRCEIVVDGAKRFLVCEFPPL